MTDDDLTPPAKRNVKALTAFLADIEPDDAVVATLTTERYGVFAVRGTVVASQILAAWTLGGHPLDANKKPQKALQLLRTFHSAEQPGADGATPAEREAEVDIAHGDLVRVSFAEEAYGEFDVSGVAVHSSVDDSVLVGGWIVATAGVTAPRARSVEALAAAGDHALAVPREISSWGTDPGADV